MAINQSNTLQALRYLNESLNTISNQIKGSRGVGWGWGGGGGGVGGGVGGGGGGGSLKSWSAT